MDCVGTLGDALFWIRSWLVNLGLEKTKRQQKSIFGRLSGRIFDHFCPILNLKYENLDKKSNSEHFGLQFWKKGSKSLFSVKKSRLFDNFGSIFA